MDASDAITKLMADGILYGEYSDALSYMNELLRPIQYEVVQWPDRSCIVLKDTCESYSSDPRAKEAEEIFTKIVFNVPVSGGILNTLIRDRWVEEVNGRLQLTKRSLVQHMDFISGLNGRYMICSVCGFLNDGDGLHVFCKSLLEEKKSSPCEVVNKSA